MDRDTLIRKLHRCAAVCAASLCTAVLLGGCDIGELMEQVPRDVVLPEDNRPGKVYLAELDNLEKPPAPGSRVRRISLEEIESGASGSFLSNMASCYAYESLSADEKLWYRDMANAMGTMAEKVKLSEDGIKAGLDENAVDKIFQSVLCDHPELFYVEGYSYTQYKRAEKTVAIEFSGTYSLNRENALRRKWEIGQAVDAILEKAPESQDDYEKVKYVYETIIRDTEYDMAAEDNQNIYSVFVNHASVCQGYAKAAQYLLDRMGVFCTLVQGRVLETGEGHAWNLVRLDGNYYYMDATWGDISYRTAEDDAKKELPRISYDYLCVTTEQIQRTHQIDSLVAMPLCTAEKDNYYVRENAVFIRPDEDQLKALAASAREQGRHGITLRCADRECYDEMYSALVERQEIFRYLSDTGGGKFAYTKNDAQLTLTFFMMTSE